MFKAPTIVPYRRDIAMLLNQPFEIVSYSLTPIVRCKCERGGIVQLWAQFERGQWSRSLGVCPSCQTTYSVNAIRESADKKTLEIGIEVGKVNAEEGGVPALVEP